MINDTKDLRLFDRRSQSIVLTIAKNCNPNGDPSNENCPRYDEGHVYMTDERPKRTVRDEMMAWGETIFIDGQPKTQAKRINELAQQFAPELLNRTKTTVTKDGKEKTEKVKYTGEEILDVINKCTDSRIFGYTIANGGDSSGEKMNVSQQGTLQIGDCITSLNACPTPRAIKGTGAFATSEDADARTFRQDYKNPFAIFPINIVADPLNIHVRDNNRMTYGDYQIFLDALWYGFGNMNSRSKFGQRAEFLLRMDYKPDFWGNVIGYPDEKMTLLSPEGKVLTTDEQTRIRSHKQFVIDITELAEVVDYKSKFFASVYIKHNLDLKFRGLDEMIENLKRKDIEVTYVTER